MKTQKLLDRGTLGAVHLQRILVPVDFSPLSKKALLYATRLAQQFGAEINIFHVVEPEVPPAFDGYMIAPPPVSNGAAAGRTGQLKGLVSVVRKTGIARVNATTRCGLAAFEIVEAAKEFDVT